MATDTAAFTTLRVIPVIEGVGASLDKQLGSLSGMGKKAGKQLGVPHANIHTWKVKISSGQSLTRNAQTNKMKSVAPIAAAPSLEEENQRLRRENAELKKVNHILKSAAAIFTRDHLS
jgi:transposase-like protein